MIREQLVPRPLLFGQLLFEGRTGASSSYFLLTGAVSMQGADGAQLQMTAGSPESCHAFSASSRLIQVRALEDSSVLTLDSALLDGLLFWQQAHADLLWNWSPLAN